MFWIEPQIRLRSGTTETQKVVGFQTFIRIDTTAWHAALLYLMRPRLSHNQKSDDIVKGLIPANFNEHRAVGMLIRGSDKCGLESQCISFDTYAYTEKAVITSQSKTGPHVIVTTKDKYVYNALEKYEQSKGDENQLKFYVN